MTNLPSLIEPSSEVVLCRMSGNIGQKNAFTVFFVLLCVAVGWLRDPRMYQTEFFP